MATRRQNAFVVAAITSLAGSLCASPSLDILHGLSLDILTALRWKVFSNRHEPASSPTVVIAFDEESYRTPPFRGTPTVAWMNEIGRIITAVVDGGALVVGFDVVFPASIEESEIQFGNETLGARMRGFDRDFLRAVAVAARAGKVVLGEVQLGNSVVSPAPGHRAAVGQRNNIRALNVSSDRDEVVRRVPLMLTVDDNAVPAMALELASRALGRAIELTADHSVNLGGYLIPTRVPNTMTLNFDGGSNDIPTYSMADLRACSAKGDADFFRRNFQGKVVLLGSTLDFEDRKMTSKRFATTPGQRSAARCALATSTASPAGRNSIDGVYVHATAINNLLRREAVTELASVPTWAVTTAGAAVSALAAFLLPPLVAALSFLGLMVAWTAVATAAFSRFLALPFVEAIFAGIVAIVATTSFRLFVVDKDKRFLRRAFSHYLAPAVIEKMLASNKPPTLGGEMRNITVFFSDLAGFSTFAEAMQPSELVTLMNLYLSAMTDVIEKHGGFVDKYIGDAIVAVFGAPIDGLDHAVDAVRAALCCCARLDELNRAAAGSKKRLLTHRIGLNSGSALVGNVGSRRRFNYTVIGDSVNLASRLEGANKYFGTSILASEETMALTGDTFEWREIDTIRVKGRVQPVRIYEPLAESGRQCPEQKARADVYSQGLARWRGRDFAGAVQSFSLAADSDSPSALFMERAKKLWLAPPVDGWEPINTLEEK